MTKKRLFSLTALLAVFIFLSALPAAAQCDPAVDESCQLSPLQSRQVNASVTRSDDTNEQLSVSGIPAPAAINDLPLVSANSLTLSVSNSGRRALSSQPEAQNSALDASSNANSPPAIDSINLRLRYQDPSDVSCGVQALGMALDGLRPEGLTAPKTAAIHGFLTGQGMMYDFGTGVEELAFAAASFGYQGSIPFHGWSLATLRAELQAGRPVVAALGSNGLGQPGHFVTVTGLSDDGQWIRYNDPRLGEVTTITEVFRALWALQGNSGVAVRAPTAPAAAEEDDFLPLLAFLAGLMALITTATPLGKYRLGVGGRFAAGSGGSAKKSVGYSTSSKKKSVKPNKPKASKPSKPKKKKSNRRKKKRKTHSTKKSSKPQAKTIVKPSKPPQEKPGGPNLAAWKEQDMAEVARQLEDEHHPANRKFASSQYSRQDEGPDLAAWKQQDMAEVDRQLDDEPHIADRLFANYQSNEPDDDIDLRAWKQADMAAVSEELKNELISTTAQPTHTPVTEEQETIHAPTRLFASLNPNSMEEEIAFSSTFIGNSPYSIDSSYGPSAGVENIVLWLRKAFGLLLGQLGIWDYGRYLNSQPHNVSGQLSYQESDYGTFINTIDFANHSGSPIKAAITIETSSGQKYIIPSQWINPGSSKIEIPSTTIGDPGNLALNEAAFVNVTLIAGYNEPALIRFLSFQVPNEEGIDDTK